MSIDRQFRNSVRDKYNSLTQIWGEGDEWHLLVHDEIAAAIDRLNEQYRFTHDLVVDIVSGGILQSIPHRTYIELDIALERLLGHKMAICADAHALPLPNGIADCVICVGPVINYCSLIETITEIGRITRTGGVVVLHVELSNSLEFLFTPHFRQDVALVTTFYRGTERIWVYSKQNVIRTLARAGFQIHDRRYFHIASALAYRVLKSPNAAARFKILDAALRRIPRIAELADSAIFICSKEA
ncbi:MAG: methyltransferase domain-containing protein [Candidatus Kapaibacterium sp.]